jgi:hypothetical protein
MLASTARLRVMGDMTARLASVMLPILTGVNILVADMFFQELRVKGEGRKE